MLTILIHTICDAILGALALVTLENISVTKILKIRTKEVLIFLKKILKIADKESYKIVNIDSTIICEKPKLSRFKNKIRKSLSSIINLPMINISIKATTFEGSRTHWQKWQWHVKQ